MNRKAELFKQYLDSRGVGEAFQIKEHEDELHSVVFAGKLEIQKQELPLLVILDDSMYGMIRVQVATNALREGKELALLELINSLNRKFKVFKYYVADDKSLLLDCCVSNSGDCVDCDAIYNIIEVILNHMGDDFAEIMKVIWA